MFTVRGFDSEGMYMGIIFSGDLEGAKRASIASELYTVIYYLDGKIVD